MKHDSLIDGMLRCHRIVWQFSVPFRTECRVEGAQPTDDRVLRCRGLVVLGEVSIGVQLPCQATGDLRLLQLVVWIFFLKPVFAVLDMSSERALGLKAVAFECTAS